MVKTAKKTAKENFEQEVKFLVEETIKRIDYSVNLNLQQFCNKSFNLAIKHSETIKKIKEEIENAKS